TNFGEKIDPAVRRRGRLDVAIPLLPPDTTARKRVLRNLLTKRLEKEGKAAKRPAVPISAAADKGLQGAASKTPLMVFNELQPLFDAALQDVQSKDTDLDRFVAALVTRAVNAEQPEISLNMYAPRFKSDGNKPFDEFLLLAYLRLESQVMLTAPEETL